MLLLLQIRQPPGEDGLGRRLGEDVERDRRRRGRLHAPEEEG